MSAEIYVAKPDGTRNRVESPLTSIRRFWIGAAVMVLSPVWIPLLLVYLLCRLLTDIGGHIEEAL